MSSIIASANISQILVPLGPIVYTIPVTCTVLFAIRCNICHLHPLYVVFFKPSPCYSSCFDFCYLSFPCFPYMQQNLSNCLNFFCIIYRTAKISVIFHYICPTYCSSFGPSSRTHYVFSVYF